MKGFGSDNHSGIHPRILQALADANQGHAPSYGTDAWTQKAERIFKTHFGPQAETFFVFNGTAANVLSLKGATRSFHACYVSDVSHMYVDECHAPEFMTGVKLLPISSQHGKMELRGLQQAHVRLGDQHCSQGRLVSLTQPTELGTCYSLKEMREIITWAKSKQLLIHIDGARLANAAVSLNSSFRELTADLQIDVLSFGGAKNGLMVGEAVIFLNPRLAEDFKYYRKQAAQLPSKTRFIAAQFIEYFTDDLWKDIAVHACAMAERLYQGVREIPGVQVTQKRESNGVFAVIPQEWVKPLREKYFFYVWDERSFECRWMTSWDTTPEDVDGFIQALKELL